MAAPLFPHLNLLFKERGNAFLEGGGSPNPEVTLNRANRAGHAASIQAQIRNYSALAKRAKEERHAKGLPVIAGGVPFLLRIPDEDDGTLEFLSEKLGLEIVAEYSDGFLIVSSEDLDLVKVLDLAKDFSNSVHGSGKMAEILDIEEDPFSPSRITRILDERLQGEWPFLDDLELILDISIEVAAFGLPKKGKIRRSSTPESKTVKHELAAKNKQIFQALWDDKRLDRESEIEQFVKHYNGEICSISDDSHIVDFPDSFAARIRMSGKGFKDLILNYPNLFEVSLPDEVQNPFGQSSDEGVETPDFELMAPASGSPSICIIDSGIQENHKWLAGAVDGAVSRCFIIGKRGDDVADYVKYGGHGTRVAGACLYPYGVPKTGTHQASFYLLNARVLDQDNLLSLKQFPADLLNEVVNHFQKLRKTRIFQHSIASNAAYRSSRMSIWATSMDLLSYRNDVLFVQAAGNINRTGGSTNPGILDHLKSGRAYPEYLFEKASRIANPAQSLQALTVGSVSSKFYDDPNVHSISGEQQPSSFSRCGFGMWDSIKPEVVEFGGEYVIDKQGSSSLTNRSELCPQLVRSTLHGGPAVTQDAVGTSFSAPKIAHIAGLLAAQFPRQSTLLYRALIVNSSRWPKWADDLQKEERPRMIRSIGYGVPDLSLATENSDSRITLVTETTYAIKAGEGFIFGIPIPETLRRQGDSYQLRIDVTLSYVAEPRRTRKSRRGYLAVWLDWKSSKKRESFDTFKCRALKDLEGEEVEHDNFQWTLGNKETKDGQTDGVSRRNGTVQKDWLIANCYELPDIFGIVVRGHKGWDRKNLEATAQFALVVSFEALGGEVKIYETIKAEIEVEATISQARIKLPV